MIDIDSLDENKIMKIIKSRVNFKEKFAIWRIERGHDNSYFTVRIIRDMMGAISESMNITMKDYKNKLRNLKLRRILDDAGE